MADTSRVLLARPLPYLPTHPPTLVQADVGTGSHCDANDWCLSDTCDQADNACKVPDTQPCTSTAECLTASFCDPGSSICKVRQSGLVW